jgi:kynureninase
VSLAVPRARQVWQTLAEERGVVCDVRDPDRLRLAPAPLYTRFTEVWDAMDRLRQVVAEER